MPVCDVIIVSTINMMLRCYHNSKRSLLIVCTLVLRFKSCRIFPRSQSVHLRAQQCGSTGKCGLRDVKRADFIRKWRRTGLKNPEKNIFIKKIVRNHSYHRFFAMIRIDRGLLYYIQF